MMTPVGTLRYADTPTASLPGLFKEYATGSKTARYA